MSRFIVCYIKQIFYFNQMTVKDSEGSSSGPVLLDLVLSLGHSVNTSEQCRFRMLMWT